MEDSQSNANTPVSSQEKSESHINAPITASTPTSRTKLSKSTTKVTSVTQPENTILASLKGLIQPTKKSAPIVPSYQPPPTYIPSADEEKVKENKENIVLIWVDSNMDLSTDDINQTKDRLRLVNDLVVFHTQLDSCLTYIRSIVNEKVFLITAGALAADILEQTRSLDQIDSVFIFCVCPEKYEHLQKTYPTLVGIYMILDDLIAAMKSDAEFLDKHEKVLNFYDQHQRHTRDLSTESAEFLWFQLFNDCILQLSHDDNAKEDMLNVSRQYYRGNLKETDYINEFQDTYSPEKAIHWYSRETFVYKMVNKALRTEDVEQLYIFRFFIGDLCKALVEEHKKILEKGENVIVYRGTRVSQAEFNKLKSNEGKLTSTNGFLSTSRSKIQAIKFANKSKRTADAVRVIFEIECDVKKLGAALVFADIAEMSQYPTEEEVLLDVAAAYLIKSVAQEKDSDMWIIKMSATTEGREMARDYIEENRKYRDDESIAIFFGRLLYDIGQYDKSQKYFERMLHSQHGEVDESPAIIRHIARAQFVKGEDATALQNYQQAYALCPELSLKERANILDGQGTVLQSLDRYDEALDCYTRALEIRKSVYGLEHPITASSLLSLADLCQEKSELDEALKYNQQALQIQQSCLPKDCVDAACSLDGIGTVHFINDEYDKALDHYSRALEMRRKCLPAVHFSIASSLLNIGNVYNNMKCEEKALDSYQSSLDMMKKCLPSNHHDIAYLLLSIGNQHSDNKTALEFLFQALEMEKACLPEYHRTTAQTLLCLSIQLIKQGTDLTKALDYARLALNMYEKCWPTVYDRIFACLAVIGCISQIQEQNDQAVEYLTRALNMQERFLKEDQELISLLLFNLGYLSLVIHDFPKVIQFLSRSIENQKKYPLSDATILARAFEGLGLAHEVQDEYDESLKCYLTALETFKKRVMVETTSVKETNTRSSSVVRPNLNQTSRSPQKSLPQYRKSESFKPKPASQTKGDHKSSSYSDPGSLVLSKSDSIRSNATRSEIEDFTRTLDNIGDVLLKNGKVDEVLKYYLQSLQLKQTYFQAECAEVAQSLSKLGDTYHHRGESDKAMDYHMRALKMREKCLPSDHTDTAASLTEIFLIFQEREKYDEAFSYALRALEMLKKCLPTDNLLIAQSLESVACVYANLEKYDDAIEYRLISHAMRERLLPEEPISIAKNLRIIGLLFEDNDNDEQALHYFNNSTQNFEKYSETPTYESVDCLYSIGKLYSRRDDPSLALEYYLRCLKLLEGNPVFDDDDMSDIHLDTGKAYTEKEEHDNALSHHLSALTFKQKCPRENDVPLIKYLRGVGMVYNDLDEYEKALDYHLRALKLDEKYLHEEDEDKAAALYNIGLAYQGAEKNEEALKYYGRALKIYELCLPSGHIDIADTLKKIGTILMEDGNVDKALPHLIKAFSYYQNDSSVSMDGSAALAATIAKIYYDKKDYDGAIEYHLHAVSLFEKCLPLDHEKLVDSLFNIGQCYKEKKDIDAALVHAERALSIAEEHLSDDQFRLTQSFRQIGALYSDQNEHKRALEFRFKALKLLETEGGNTVALANVLEHIGQSLYKMNEIDRALEYYRRCAAVVETWEMNSKTIVGLAEVYFRMANISKSENDEKALEYGRHSLDLREKHCTKEQSEKIIESLMQIAEICEKRGELEQAEIYRSRVLSIKKNEENTVKQTDTDSSRKTMKNPQTSNKPITTPYQKLPPISTSKKSITATNKQVTTPHEKFPPISTLKKTPQTTNNQLTKNEKKV